MCRRDRLQVMKSTGRIYDKAEHRMTFEGILYRMRTGIPWRDLPPEFGEWSTVYRRFNLWSKKGILDNIFSSLSSMADFEWVFLDGSIVRAHQHSTGAATESSEQIGKSRGGNSTKIHLAVDSGGLPICFDLSEGQRHDIVQAKSLVEQLDEVNTIVCDKGYDSEPFRTFVKAHGGETVIAKRNYGQDIDKASMDWCLYKYRHLVENAFARIKHYRAISSRYSQITILCNNTQMAYSLDFRQRVFAYKEKHQLTFEQTSKHFGINIATLFRWQKRLEPCTTRNRPATKVDMDALIKDIEAFPDDYQWERAKRLNVTQPGIHYALKRLKIRFKKNSKTPKGL